MALPKINDIPKFSVKVPSSGKTATFRPFLVKEQKVLLMALESQDSEQILQSLIDTVESCLLTKINLKTLSTFDIEYLFLQIRAKSVGEISTIQIKCNSCETYNEVAVPLEQVQVDTADIKSNRIELTDKYTLKMRYPSYYNMDKSEGIYQQFVDIDSMYNTMLLCLDEILTEEEVIKFDSETKENKVEFLDSLTPQQFDKITEFLLSTPVLSHDIKFKCVNCGADNEHTLAGLNSFFS